MSSTLETDCPGYSDIDEHTETYHSDVHVTESSYENQLKKYNETTDNTDDSITCMRRTRTFARDGFKITTYICKRNTVEICYTSDGNQDVHEVDELRHELADHLKIDSQLIKMTKLRATPVYKETSIRSGETATIHSKGSCKIGAFVHVAGKGNHVLMSAHEKSEGDLVLYPSGKRLGAINVSLHPSLQPRSTIWDQDVALARLEQQDGFTARVVSADHGQLSLAQQPIEAEEGMSVRCFDAKGNRGRVDSAMYIRQDERFDIQWRLISIIDDDGEPIHGEGDSGVLVVYGAPNEERVAAVGMLVGIEELHLDDREKTTRRTSLAVPLVFSFQALERQPYCSGVLLKFLND